MSVTKSITELQALIDEARIDADKFENYDNKSAGTRVRKIMQEIKTVAQEIRIAVQNKKKVK